MEVDPDGRVVFIERDGGGMERSASDSNPHPKMRMTSEKGGAQMMMEGEERSYRASMEDGKGGVCICGLVKTMA